MRTVTRRFSPGGDRFASTTRPLPTSSTPFVNAVSDSPWNSSLKTISKANGRMPSCSAGMPSNAAVSGTFPVVRAPVALSDHGAGPVADRAHLHPVVRLRRQARQRPGRLHADVEDLGPHRHGAPRRVTAMVASAVGSSSAARSASSPSVTSAVNS